MCLFVPQLPLAKFTIFLHKFNESTSSLYKQRVCIKWVSKEMCGVGRIYYICTRSPLLQKNFHAKDKIFKWVLWNYSLHFLPNTNHQIATISFSFPILVIIEKGKETYIYRIITKFFFNGVSSYKKKNCVMYTYFIPNCREIFTTERFQIQCFHMQILLDNNIVGSFLKTTFGKMYFDLSSEDSTGNIPYYHYNIFSL